MYFEKITLFDLHAGLDSLGSAGSNLFIDSIDAIIAFYGEKSDTITEVLVNLSILMLNIVLPPILPQPFSSWYSSLTSFFWMNDYLLS